MHGGWRRVMWRDSRRAMSSPIHERDRRPQWPHTPATTAWPMRSTAGVLLAQRLGRTHAYYDLTSATIWP